MKGTRAIKSWSKHNLPVELWPEILSRLPTKSLLRFRCVSKSWRSLIDDPSFCRLHLNNFNNNIHETHLFVYQYGVSEEQDCVVRCSKTFKTRMRLDIPNPINGCTKRTLSTSLRCGDSWFVSGCADGLVLLKHALPTKELILWNPSIRRARNLPLLSTISIQNVDLGIGFNPSIKDYQHVRLVPRDETNLHSIVVYTVGTNSWKTIRFQDAGCTDWRWPFHNWFLWNTVCCRGILYFTPRNEDSDPLDMVSFDLSKEVLDSTSLPPIDGLCSTVQALSLGDGECSLGWINFSPTHGSIWELESSKNGMFWTKRYSFASRICKGIMHQFIYLKNDGKMLLQCNKQVISYNLETHEEKSVLLNGCGWEMNSVCGYIESLLLLNG